jgi:hypothetical protein
MSNEGMKEFLPEEQRATRIISAVKAVCLLACISLPVFGQTPATPAQRDLDAKLTVLQRRGAEVLSRERHRSKANLCAKAGPSDESLGQCYLAEGKVTNADYTEYVRVVGALLRLPRYSKGAFPGAPRHLDIDTAETTWLTTGSKVAGP